MIATTFNICGDNFIYVLVFICVEFDMILHVVSLAVRLIDLLVLITLFSLFGASIYLIYWNTVLVKTLGWSFPLLLAV